MKKVIVCLLTMLLLSSCEEDEGTSLSYFSSGSSSSASSASSDAYSYLEVYGADVDADLNTTDPYLLFTCQVDNGSPEGTIEDCTEYVDEAKLYNMELTFLWGTNEPESCPMLKFYPYYYRASNSAAFLPEWTDSAVDCSDPETDDSAHCYGGAAKHLSDLQFPSENFFLNNTILTTYNSATLKSAFEIDSSSNRHASNPPLAYVVGADRTMTGGIDGIVSAFPGSYTGDLLNLQEYSVVCEDSFADPLYTIRLFLRDYDTTTAPPEDPDNATLNDYPDWDSSDPDLDPN